jgi:hypothetical protein
MHHWKAETNKINQKKIVFESAVLSKIITFAGQF